MLELNHEFDSSQFLGTKPSILDTSRPIDWYFPLKSIVRSICHAFRLFFHWKQRYSPSSLDQKCVVPPRPFFEFWCRPLSYTYHQNLTRPSRADPEICIKISVKIILGHPVDWCVSVCWSEFGENLTEDICVCSKRFYSWQSGNFCRISRKIPPCVALRSAPMALSSLNQPYAVKRVAREEVR